MYICLVKLQQREVEMYTKYSYQSNKDRQRQAVTVLLTCWGVVWVLNLNICIHFRISYCKTCKLGGSITSHYIIIYNLIIIVFLV